MIFIGNDIVKISRIGRLLKKYDNHFLSKVFDKDEIDIANGKKYKTIHLSGKFAAKEASKKALSAAGFSRIYLKDIVILNRQDGSPYVRDLCGQVAAICKLKNIQISISHTDEYATAVAIVRTSN